MPLSGAMAELPIAPGQPYVEVEYDYEYKSKERLIKIHQGECFVLLKKTNEDWWQVRRVETTKPFYVPAQYVRETRKALMPPAKPAHGHVNAPTAQTNHPTAQTTHPSAQTTRPTAQTTHPTAQTTHPTAHATNSAQNTNPTAQTGAAVWVKPTNLELPDRSETLNRRESSSRRSSSSHSASGHGGEGSPLHSPHHGPSEADRALAEVLVPGGGGIRGASNSSTLPRSRARSPDLQRAPLDVDTHMDSGEDIRTNESESGDELSSSSTEHLQTVPSSGGQYRPESPVYTNLQELKISGSLPPPPSGSPLGTLGDWDTYRDLGGRLFYVHHSTQERTWKPPRVKEQGRGEADSTERLKHVDDQGREYFYSADGRSEWELPKYNHSPPHLSAEGAKTRSLDRKQKQVEPIVLTKSWRHSTHVPEPNDKRLLKSRRLRSVSTRLQPFSSVKQDPTVTLRVPGPDSGNPPSSPKPPSSPSEKCGVLNMTKITEHGKRVRKNWQSQWTVLQGSTLLFAKGQGGGSSWFGGQSKPELTVVLKGGSVEWASKDKSSKKHCIELKTRQGTELLIQSDNEGLINDWFRALQDCVSTHAWESDEAIEEDMPESPGREEKSDKEKEHRDSKKSRAMKSSSSIDATENKKTRHKLKKFLTRRPTLQAVKDKGYIKDQVFGCSLSSLCQREAGSVPQFVEMCIDHVETTSLSVDGLYRVSGNLAVIQKLRYAVNHDEKVTLSDSKWEDVHVTTGALKMFFRELPEPLFTYTLFQDFVSAIKSPDYNQRVHLIKDLVRQLPKPNHDTMQALFKHLHKVVDHGDNNRMTIQSVAIVFGPTLLRPETETWNMAVHMVYQNQIVELCLIECDHIFGR